MEYWQRERGNKKSDLQQAQSQSSSGTELSSHSERSGKNSEALFDQLRSSNHGGLLMAEESAPTHLVPPIPSPSRQASPDTGRLPWFSTLSPFLHPRDSEFWSRTYSAALSDVKETPSWLCGHLAERNNEGDFCWEHIYAPYGKREEAKKSASSVLDNVQSGSKTYRRWPVAAENSQHDVIEVENRETTTYSLEMHENTPVRCHQESSSTGTCNRMKEYPESSDLGGDVDCGIPSGEGRDFDAGAGGWGEEGTSTSVTGKHRREDCSPKPKSRKKMKASKIRSNMIGKPISRQPSEVESISSPAEPTEILLQMAEEGCDTQAEALCRSSQDLRQGQRDCLRRAWLFMLCASSHLHDTGLSREVNVVYRKNSFLEHHAGHFEQSSLQQSDRKEIGRSVRDVSQ